MNRVNAERWGQAQAKVDRWNSEIGVLITAHSDQRRFLRACIESVREIGPIVLGYDKPNNMEKGLPKPEILEAVDYFFIKHFTRMIPGPTYPQFWLFRHGLDFLLGSHGEFIFVIGADSILENPSGMKKIKELLGNEDIIACSTRNQARHKAPFCGTKSFLARKKPFKRLMAHVERGLAPVDGKVNLRLGNMESRFGQAVRDLDFKEAIVPKLPNDDQFSYRYDGEGRSIERGTWGEVLGYRHLGGEHKIRKQKRIKPIDRKYFDEDYLRGPEIKTLQKYWDTGEEKFLEEWWNLGGGKDDGGKFSRVPSSQ